MTSIWVILRIRKLESVSIELLFSTRRMGFISSPNNYRKANGKYTCGEYSCPISLHFSTKKKIKQFFSLFYCFLRHVFFMEGSCSKAEWPVHTGQALCFGTGTRSSLGNWLTCSGLVSTLALPALFKCHTIQLYALIRKEMHLIKKILYQALFSSPTTFLEEGHHKHTNSGETRFNF